ncbi:Chemotaxis response regulator protein-glutamate methylesterase [bacterium HR15]|nr:Chemotaxis response regulator protein-glutamate methylesterase [bacterium HR15]
MSKIRVLVVDDSLFMRRMISELLTRDPDIEVVGAARDGQEGLELARQLKPDVITLDVEMPLMDGITMLERLMQEQPTPVVMVSSLTREGAEITLQCLERGAIDFVTKPSGAISLDLYKVSSQIIEKVKTAARVPRHRLRAHFERPMLGSAPFSEPKITPNSSAGASPSKFRSVETCPLVVIGASTGGPRALSVLISQLPSDLIVPMLIIQHMPEGFTRSFAERLDKLTHLRVREAQEGDRIEAGMAYLAPGGHHLQVRRGGSLHLSTEPPLHGVRPAVDITLLSLAQNYSGKLVVAILTGMGNDGAMGVRALHAKGARILAEDERSCVVFGMPRAAIQTGCVHRVVPIEQMATAIAEEVQSICKTSQVA